MNKPYGSGTKDVLTVGRFFPRVYPGVLSGANDKILYSWKDEGSQHNEAPAGEKEHTLERLRNWLLVESHTQSPRRRVKGGKVNREEYP